MMLNKLKTTYNKLPLPVKASFWFMFAEIINKGISFISTPIFTRLLSKSDYGYNSVYNSWATILSIIATLQLSTGVFNKAMIKYEDARKEYTSSMLVITTLITLLNMTAVIILYPYLEKIIGLPISYIYILYINILFSSAASFWMARERFSYNYKSVVSVTVVTNILAVALSLLLVIENDSDKVVYRLLGNLIVHVVVYGVIFVKVIIEGKRLINVEYWKYSILYNLPLVPHYLSQQVLNQSDRIMISNMCGSSDAAVYSLAYQLAILMQLVLNAIHATFMPWTFQKLKKGQNKDIGLRSLQIEVIIGVLCLTFSLFAPELILILGGKDYSVAVYIVPPVSMSVLLMTIYSFFGNIQFYYEKTTFVMAASIITAFLNVALNYVFIDKYGFIAAGYTTLFCYIVYSAIHYTFMIRVCRELNVENPYNGKLMFLIAILFSLISISISFLYEFVIIRYIVILVLALAVCIWISKNKDILKKSTEVQ